MDATESRDEEKARVIRECERKTLLDAAFSVVNWNRNVRLLGPQPKGGLIDLGAVFPSLDAHERAEAECRAEKLYNSANQYSHYYESVWNSVRANVRDEIRKDHPGFSDSSYQSVLARANHIAIK